MRGNRGQIISEIRETMRHLTGNGYMIEFASLDLISLYELRRFVTEVNRRLWQIERQWPPRPKEDPC